jgi:hypothetical protein
VEGRGEGARAAVARARVPCYMDPEHEERPSVHVNAVADPSALCSGMAQSGSAPGS